MSRRPRLTLFSLLLLTALAATSMTTAMLWREVGPLRQEVYRLRDEVGELVIRDESKLHAIRVPVEPTSARREWRWRVWWPKEQSYRLRCADGPIPKAGFPESNGWSQLEGGAPNVISVVATKDPDSERWSTRTEFKRSGSGGGYFSGSAADWLDTAYVLEVGGVHEQTKLFETGESVVLCRYRSSDKVNNSSKIPDPADGFMIWLEPMP